MFHDIPHPVKAGKTWRDFLAPGLGIAGGITGAILGGPAGAVAGYGLGQGIGGLANSGSDQGTVDTNAGIKNALAGWQGIQADQQQQQLLAARTAATNKGNPQLVPTQAPSGLPSLVQPTIQPTNLDW